MSPPSTLRRSLRLWLAIQVLLGIGGAVAAGILLSRRYAFESVGSNLHATYKALTYAWHNVLLRGPYLAGALALAGVAAAILPRLRGPAFGIAAALVALLALVGGWSGHRVLLPAAVVVLLLNLAPPPARSDPPALRAAAWLPGSLLLLPVPVARLAGVPLPAVGRVLVGFALALLWFGFDQVLGYGRYRYAVTRWPDDHAARDVTVVEKVRDGDYHEYHDIDVVGDRLVAIAEQTHRLLALDLEGRVLDAWKLPEKWMPPTLGNVLDSESDVRRGVTWYLGGPFHVAGLRWEDGRWTEPFRSPAIDLRPEFAGRYLPEVRATGHGRILHAPTIPGLLHTYSALAEEREELLVVTIGPRLPLDYPLLIALRTPDLDVVRTLALRTREGLLLPTPRDVEWMPTLDRILVAPDFWDTLYVADPDTGIAEPFLDAPLSNGSLLWSPEIDRLLLAVPAEMSIWVIDPYRRQVERRIRTQPGVRPIALDARHGLLLTASVLTGTVLVQRWEDGAVVDRFGAFMPMIRDMVVHPDSGTAFLTTWSAIYRFPYLRRLR